MATLEERFEWLKGVLSEKNEGYADYLRDDFAIYLDLEILEIKDLATRLNKKFELFQNCESKDDVREFVSRIVSFMIMKDASEDGIIHYLSYPSNISIKERL